MRNKLALIQFKISEFNKDKLIVFVLAISLIVNIYLLFRMTSLLRENSFLNQSNSQYINANKETNARLQMAFASPSPPPIYNGSKIDIPDFGFSLTCISNATCTYHVENEPGRPEWGVKPFKLYIISIGKVAFTVTKLDLTTLNNPNYGTVIGWFNGLLHKDPKAFGANLDPNYGITYRPGTDGAYLPSYRSFDVDSITPELYGNILGLYIKSTQQYTVDFLVPNGQDVYRFLLGDTIQTEVDSVNGLLKTIKFD